MSIVVDSNVILDILTEDKNWFNWSSEMIIKYAENHDLIINQIIYSEISIRFSHIEELDQVLAESNFKYEHLPWEAAFLAGKCFIKHKKLSKTQSMILPDFYIGAHAAITNRPLLTRDLRRYGYYFRELKLITPKNESV